MSRIALIQVAGGSHGDQRYARSPVHDNVAECLRETGIDMEVLFVPSTEVGPDPVTGAIHGQQMSPSWQLDRLQIAIQEAHDHLRTPIAIAHSLGTIATVRALRDGTLPYAVLVSPVFINSRAEHIDSPRVRQRTQLVQDPNDPSRRLMELRTMPYPVTYSKHHLDDPMYLESIITNPTCLAEIKRLIATNVRIFVSQHDWNPFAHLYCSLLSATNVAGEQHSFEIGGHTSAQLIADAAMELTDDIQQTGCV